MPSVSKAQQRLMAAAEHGADFPMAKKLRQSMTHDQLHDFAVGPMFNKPEHVFPAAPMQRAEPAAVQTPDPGAMGPALQPPTPSIIGGSDPSIISANMNAFKGAGHSEFEATRRAIHAARHGKPRKSTHKNLGKFLHPRKDGKKHGSDKV